MSWRSPRCRCQLILHKLIPRGNLLHLRHLCCGLSKAIGQRIAVKCRLGHNNAKVLQSFCFTGEYGFQLGVCLVLDNVVERRHVSGQDQSVSWTCHMPAVSPNPNAFAIAPNVPVNLLAMVSRRPNCVAAFFANPSTCLLIVGKRTSTTFWTSARSDPNSIQTFQSQHTSLLAKAAAKCFACFFGQFLYPGHLLSNSFLFTTRSRPIWPTLSAAIYSPALT